MYTGSLISRLEKQFYKGIMHALTLPFMKDFSICYLILY
jgi:hypothetical protein